MINTRLTALLRIFFLNYLYMGFKRGENYYIIMYLKKKNNDFSKFLSGRLRMRGKLILYLRYYS